MNRTYHIQSITIQKSGGNFLYTIINIINYIIYYCYDNRYKVMEEGYVFKQMMEFVSRLLKTKRKNKDLIKLSDGFDIDERDCE